MGLHYTSDVVTRYMPLSVWCVIVHDVYINSVALLIFEIFIREID
jgi:hypothetical protein